MVVAEQMQHGVHREILRLVLKSSAILLTLRFRTFEREHHIAEIAAVRVIVHFVNRERENVRRAVYAALFAVIARYIGFESFVRTGEFIFETMFGTGHHGWTSIYIDGKEYVFDPQRDYRICFDATQPDKFYYFGVDEEHAWRYNPEECNDARDAGFAKPGTDFVLSELVQRMLPLVQAVPTEPHEVPIGA